MLNQSSTIAGRQYECGRDEEFDDQRVAMSCDDRSCRRVMGLAQRKTINTQPIQREIAFVYAVIV